MRLLFAGLVLGLCVPAWAADPPAAEELGLGTPMNAAEQAFAKKLTGTVLTGRFTIDGQAEPPKAERYQIVSASKAVGDDWIIVARVQYGENDVRVPVPVKVLWAGDTPVITLTDLTIPGLGTFSSRVLFYGDRYAGTWQHGDKGGHLFGTIGKPSKEE